MCVVAFVHVCACECVRVCACEREKEMACNFRLTKKNQLHLGEFGKLTKVLHIRTQMKIKQREGKTRFTEQNENCEEKKKGEKGKRF